MTADIITLADWKQQPRAVVRVWEDDEGFHVRVEPASAYIVKPWSTFWKPHLAGLYAETLSQKHGWPVIWPDSDSGGDAA